MIPAIRTQFPNDQPAYHYRGADLVTDSTKKTRAAEIISSFENSTTDIQYGYTAVLKDGRGITAGRAGFTTGTHDLLQVVQRYTANMPGNTLAQYLPALKAVDGTDSIKDLDGLPKAWKQTADSDPAFRRAQDEIYDELYFNPAMQRADKAGVTSPLGQLILLDTVVQQGDGNDMDSLSSILAETKKANGQINTKLDEPHWLGKFLDIRKRHLQHAADPDTRAAWKESTGRVDALRTMLKSRNYGLDVPIKWQVYGDNFTITN
jgi:chitosanase